MFLSLEYNLYMYYSYTLLLDLLSQATSCSKNVWLSIRYILQVEGFRSYFTPY